MKIDLPLENWFDSLAQLPRLQLGQIVPQIGDRQFATIAQIFLHEHGEIRLHYTEITIPDDEESNGRPMVRVWRHSGWGPKMELPFWPMQSNIKHFHVLRLRYFDMSVLNFLQIFKQKFLFENVNLNMSLLSERDMHILVPILVHVLPLVNNINAINLWDIKMLDHVYGDKSSGKEHAQLLVTMMEKARVVLTHNIEIDHFLDHEVDWWCRWLYTPRLDGQPRMLDITRICWIYTTNISPFIDRLKRDFLLAKQPVSFFICLRARLDHWQDSSLENAETNEKLVMKRMEESADTWKEYASEVILLIGRYPLEARKEWIEANEANNYYRKYCGTIKFDWRLTIPAEFNEV